MRNASWLILLAGGYLLIAIFWLRTFVILGNSPLLDGPQNEANRAMAFFVGRTATCLLLGTAVCVLGWLTRPRRKRVDARKKPKGASLPLD
jgi:hypothetical protein